MRLIKIKQQTKEWLEWRKNKITATDATAIMGVSPYKDVDKLYEEKVKCYEPVVNSYMQRGKDLEPIALAAFENETGMIMFPMVGCHEEIDWMAASFDGMTIERDVILEIKCPGKKDHSTALKGQIPKKYYPQIQHQIHVAGVEFSYYYSFDGSKGIIIEVKRDEEFIEKMIEEEKVFWNCIQTFTPPKLMLREKICLS